MAEHTKKSLKMITNGMALGIASDLQPQGKFQFLQNIRVFTEGILESRPRLNTFLTLAGAPTGNVPHSLRTIINKIDESFLRIAGSGTKLYTGIGAVLAEKDTGLSGNPLSMIDFRPEESTEAYLYIADGNKFRKVSVSDAISDVGISAPAKASTWGIGKPERVIIDAIEAGSETDWNNGIGSITAPTLETRVDTTITKYLADGALPNFASIVPVAFTANLQAGMALKLNGAETIIVDEVLPAALKTGLATISKIVYDAGAAGICTIVLSISSSDIIRNSILLLNGTEYVRVEDVTYDDKGIPSIRTTTVATFAAGNTVSGVSSFRFYTTVNYAAANTVIGKTIKTAIIAADTSTLYRNFVVDLTNTGVGGKPLTDEDIFHISLRVSNPSVVTEVQIRLDIDSGASLFEQNYFLYSISPNFFTGSADQTTPTVSVLQQVIQRRELLERSRQYQRYSDFDRPMYDAASYDPTWEDVPTEVPVISPAETTLGQEQWTEIDIRLGDFKRVGSDLTRTKKDIKAIGVSVISTGAVDLYIDSLWMGGSEALEAKNSQGFLPYNYVWRTRDPATKEVSNWSPPLRNGIKLSRGRVVLSFPNANANYPVTYKIDIARFGGTLNSFRIVGSIDNDGSSYTDTSSDRIIADNPAAGRFEVGSANAVFDYYKPFAVLDTPKRGTCDVTGTSFLWKTLDKLNITYPRGTQIVINGKANKFYSSPSSDTQVELETDMGFLTNVKFEIREPLLTGQPLPIIFGPFGEGNFGLFNFGLGYKKAPGTVYWTDGNSIGTMSDLNHLEITSPSEPLISGVMYDGFPYVWSIERSFQLTPVFNGSDFGFIARENANSRGLYAPYAITVGRDAIYHLSENADGIYKVAGVGNPQAITTSIANLFYNNGKPPTPITLLDGTIIYPPDFSLKNDLRLFATKDYVHFRFIDTQGKHRVLVFDQSINDWISYDTFPADKINAIHYEERESSTIMLAGIPDGVAKFEEAGVYEDLIKSKIIPFSFDNGDSRQVKEFNEIVIKADQGLDGFTIKNAWDDGDSTELSTILGDIAHEKQDFIINIPEDSPGKQAKNVSTIFEWLIKSGTKLFEEIFYLLPQGDIIENRVSDVESGEGIGAKLWQGVVIQADTFGADKILNYYDDTETLKATLTINHNGKQTISYGFPEPFISHTIKRTSDDDQKWLAMKEVYVYDVEPESAKVWEGEFDTHTIPDLHLIIRMSLAYRSEAEAKIILEFDSGIIDEYVLPTSNGDFKIHKFYVACRKWKACKYRIESVEDIRVYKRASEVWIKGTNSQNPFQPINPFGGLSNQSEIMI